MPTHFWKMQSRFGLAQLKELKSKCLQVADAKWEATQFMQQNVCEAQKLETPMTKKVRCVSKGWKPRFSCLCVRSGVRPLLDPFLNPAQPGKYLFPTLAEDWKFIQSTEASEPDAPGRVKDGERVSYWK